MLKRDRWGDSSDEDEPPRNSEKYIKKKITSVDREASKPLKEVQSSTAAEAIVTEDFTGTDSVTKSAVYTEEKSTEKTHIYNFLVNGCRSVDEYERISYISQGTFGLVYKAKCNHTNDIVALKEVKLTADVKKVGSLYCYQIKLNEGYFSLGSLLLLCVQLNPASTFSTFVDWFSCDSATRDQHSLSVASSKYHPS